MIFLKKLMISLLTVTVFSGCANNVYAKEIREDIRIKTAKYTNDITIESIEKAFKKNGFIITGNNNMNLAFEKRFQGGEDYKDYRLMFVYNPKIMTKLLKLVLAAGVAMMLTSTTASADVKKGQKLYSKKLKKACNFSGAKMASKHSQDEWTSIQEAGKLADEIKSICPSVKDKSLKGKYLPHYYDFFNEYASDSGNVPSC